ncbi:MAG: type II toxin-antitoxin system VapC family toxin [Pseudomonadota bacterium]
MTAAPSGDVPDPSAGAVVDASVAVKWVIGEAGSIAAAGLLDGRALVAPDLILPECANILWKKATRGEIDAQEAGLAADILARMEVELVGHRRLMPDALRLALDLRHPAYDCAYLALALDRGLPMVTADLRLVRTVAAHGRYAGHVRSLDEAGG